MNESRMIGSPAKGSGTKPLFRWQGGKQRLCKRLLGMLAAGYRDFRLFAVPPAPAIGAGRQPVGEVVIANFEPRMKAAGLFGVAA